MRVKRYIVETMPDAMLKIRKDLGGDAVILSTKKIKVGGFLGMFGKARLEVIAGVDEDVPAEPKVGSGSATIGREWLQSPNHGVLKEARPAAPAAYRENSEDIPAPTVSQAYVSQGVTAGRTGAQAYRRTAELLGGVPETENEPDLPARVVPPVQVTEPVKEALPADYPSRRDTAPAASQLAAAESASSIEATLKTFNTMMSAAVHPSDEEFRNRLLDDIQQMKAMMNKLAKAQNEEPLLPEALDSIWKRLKAQEVEPGLAESWIKPAFEAWEASGEGLDPAEMKRMVRREISGFLDNRISGGISDAARMVYVAGPTGVGKTTTIAKMAADQIFRNHKKVGFITADTYRISAVEQLRTYASILNVPLEVVQSPGDMKRAASRLEECDLIFMDTAGRNYLNELYVAELHSLLTVKEQSETCLVLSLTSKPGDMKAIADHFSKYGLDKVIFTKLDETESCGGMFNLLADYPLQLLFLTNGQNVPDDLVPADKELLVNELLGDEGV